MLKKIFVFTLLLSFIHFPKVSAVNCDIEVGPNKQYKTIQSGINAATQNQTVCVYYNTYNETIEINKKGLKVIGITKNNKKPVIDGKYELPTGELYDEGVFNGNYSYGYVYTALVTIGDDNIVFDNFEITRSRGRAILVGGVDSVSILNSNIHDIRKNGVSCLSCNNFLLKDTSVIRAINFAPFVRASGDLGSWGAAVKTRGSNGVTIEGVTVAETWGEGINPLFSDNVTVRNSISYNNWRLNIYADNITNGLFENNLSYHTNNRPEGMPKSDGMVLRVENAFGGQGGSQVGAANKNIVIRNNFFINNNSGISFGKQNDSYKNENIKIYNNTIINPDSAGILIRKGSNDTGFIKSNIIIGGISGATGLQVSNNITSNPGLVNQNALMSNGQTDLSNYLLKQNSSAINSGDSIDGLEKDYFGCLRNNRPDIGAQEYNATNCSGQATTPTPTTNVPSPTIDEPTPTTTIPANKYDITENGVVDILDIIEVIKYVFGG